MVADQVLLLPEKRFNLEVNIKKTSAFVFCNRCYLTSWRRFVHGVGGGRLLLGGHSGGGDSH